MTNLLIIKGPMEGQSFSLNGGTTVVGRASESDIRINDPSISRRHARILRKGGKIFIEDLNSQNGTWIKGRPLKPWREFEVREGLPIAVGNIFISLGENCPEDGMITQYTIQLTGESGEGKPHLFYKDSRITDRRRLEMIYEVSMHLMQSLDIHEICEKIMESLFTCLKRIDSGVILLVDNKTGQLKPVIARSRNGRKNPHLNYSRTIVNRVLREGKAVMMADTSRENEDELSESIEMMRIKSIMCVPLISKSKIRGVIYVHSINVPHGFGRDDLFLFTGLSSPAALAIDNALLYAKSRRSEEAHHASEKKYRLLVENAIDAIFIVQDGLIKFANPSTFKLTGLHRESLSRCSFTSLFHPEDRGLILERHTRKLKGEAMPDTLSFRLRDRAGEVRHVQTNIVGIEWGGKPATLYFVRDMTEQMRLEEQLLQLRKMDAISLLAARISHDINNILMGIQGNTSLMLLDADEQHPYHKKLKNIEKYIEKGADLTEQIAGFARGGKYVVKETNINLLLTKSLENFGKTRKDLKIYRKFQTGVWSLEIDQKQIEKVFLQLFENARRAMPGGGELCLETKNIHLAHDFAGPLGLVPGRYVKISITDSGVGMDEATRKQIFDPFFTTEAMGRGSGLGLAAVYGVVKNHEG
ncbi:MAG: PAS domain S-box protein, partial [Pseudomonadota bacterium]